MAINKKSIPETSSERLIYVGPSFRDGKLLKFQVFIGGLPTYIEDVLARCPEVTKLFVPIKDLVSATKATATAGTPLHKYYTAAVAAQKED